MPGTVSDDSATLVAMMIRRLPGWKTRCCSLAGSRVERQHSAAAGPAAGDEPAAEGLAMSWMCRSVGMKINTSPLLVSLPSSSTASSTERSGRIVVVFVGGQRR